MRFVVILFLLLIVASLGSALLMLLRGGNRAGPSTRMAHALAIRVGLSLALFALLMAGFASGLIDGKL